MSAIENHLNLHAQALQLRERRNGVLASNIANAATPGFKARDMDFKAELSQAIGAGQLKTTSEGHIPVGGTGAAGMLYRKPTTSALDGNTVEIAVEQMEFAQNTLRYQSSLEFLNRKIRGLTRAIKGE